MRKKKRTDHKKYIVAGLLACIVFGTAFIFFKKDTSESQVPPYEVSSLEKSYSNSQHQFSLLMPESFLVRESSSEGIDTIVLENPDSTIPEGIQIVVSDFDDIEVLDQEMIERDIPDMKISDSQPVEIGLSHRGLAFKSDNEAFGGASREVWFVFRGKLYQISTYERLDPLLQAMFMTWKFE